MFVPIVRKYKNNTYRNTYEKSVQELSRKSQLKIFLEFSLDKLKVISLKCRSAGNSGEGKSWRPRFRSWPLQKRIYLPRMKQYQVGVNTLTKLLYSVAEAAEILSCCKGTVYKLINSKRIPVVHQTSDIRITASALINYVRQLEEDSRMDQASLKRAMR